MKAEKQTKLVMLSSIVGIDDGLIRAFLVLEILSRSGKDFQELICRLFGRTWEYKILELLIKNGQMHKNKICLMLFPDRKDVHYILSRPNQITYAFDYLLDKGIIILVKDYGNKKIYDISPIYKPILRTLFCGEVLALLER